ncbi:MAG TPA: FprA family A-type flavoprotein [Candidatus Enterenecus merdae]|nr:FprA family A-type flavoprotein [Candidatus Enterenecus merdae]
MGYRPDTQAVCRVGCYDDELDLFECQYVVPEGISYNSYVILDEQIAVMDTVDPRKSEEWLDNLEQALDGRQPDYLIIHHMEPDHSGNIARLAALYPEMKLVGNLRTFFMLTQFTGQSYEGRTITVGEGDTLELGRHTLRFFMAPMVHWPEVMMSYEQTEKVLFSADAFGRFGNPDESLPWEDEGRRYYCNIVGKYGVQVQAVLKKVAQLDIQAICPLHGPVLTGERISRALELYDLWSRYQPEERGVLVAFASIHGHTAKAAQELVEMLTRAGVKAELFDLARQDWAQAVAQTFRYSGLVLAASSYDGGVFTPMAQFLYRMKIRNLQNRVVGLVENGSWGPTALLTMQAAVGELKNMKVLEQTVTIRSALNEESRAQMERLAAAMAAAV